MLHRPVDFIMLHMLLSSLWKLATTLSEEKRGVGRFCTTEKEKTAREGESLTEGPLKAGAVNRGLIGMSRRPTIGSSLYTQEDGISILMCYKLGKRKKKDGRHQSRTERSQRLKHLQWSMGWLWKGDFVVINFITIKRWWGESCHCFSL